VAQICKQHEIPHLINNAYGVQASSTAHLITEATKKGRVDMLVQSTDKNFLVPVGGAILASNDKDLLSLVNSSYPGRASAAPVLDLFITLLSMGSATFQGLLKQRKAAYKKLQQELGAVAAKHGERLLQTKHNPISLAMTLETFVDHEAEGGGSITFLGSMLFSRNVSGSRAISGGGSKTVAGICFPGYGAHANAYPIPYLTAAAAMGMTEIDVVEYCQRLDSTLTELRSKSSGKALPRNLCTARHPTAQAAEPTPPQGEAAPAEAADGPPQGEATEGPVAEMTFEFEPDGFLTTLEVPLHAQARTVLGMVVEHSRTFFEDGDCDIPVGGPMSLTDDEEQALKPDLSLEAQGVAAKATLHVVPSEWVRT